LRKKRPDEKAFSTISYPLGFNKREKEKLASKIILYPSEGEEGKKGGIRDSTHTGGRSLSLKSKDEKRHDDGGLYL